MHECYYVVASCCPFEINVVVKILYEPNTKYSFSIGTYPRIVLNSSSGTLGTYLVSPTDQDNGLSCLPKIERNSD